jgi:hypothetical protein
MPRFSVTAVKACRVQIRTRSPIEFRDVRRSASSARLSRSTNVAARAPLDKGLYPEGPRTGERVEHVAAEIGTPKA